MVVPVTFKQRVIAIVDDPRYGQKETARLAKVSVTTVWRITEQGLAGKRTIRKFIAAFPSLSTIIIPH